MEVPDDRRYTPDHEWARLEDGRVRVGITDYAQDALGDVVFVQVPDVGAVVSVGDSISEVESTKSVSDIYSPLSGKVVERNDELEQNPDLINSEPYGKGWLFTVEVTGEGDLLDADAYQKLIDEA
jgi:glycine cleavage system H protein